MPGAWQVLVSVDAHQHGRRSAISSSEQEFCSIEQNDVNRTAAVKPADFGPRRRAAMFVDQRASLNIAPSTIPRPEAWPAGQRPIIIRTNISGGKIRRYRYQNETTWTAEDTFLPD